MMRIETKRTLGLYRNCATRHRHIGITFQSAEIRKDGLNLDREGLRGPSSTWTYMISDNPFGDILQRLFRGLKRKLGEESKLGDS